MRLKPVKMCFTMLCVVLDLRLNFKENIAKRVCNCIIPIGVAENDFSRAKSLCSRNSLIGII